MLTISPETVSALRAAHFPAFAERMRETLLATYPHFLPCFPLDAQRAIVTNMLDRARGWGLTRQDALFAFCRAMIEIAPNFDRVPQIEQAIAGLGDGREQFADLAASLPPPLRALARARASNLPLFLHPSQDARADAERLAAALALALVGRPEVARPASTAAEAIAQAQALGLSGESDGALVVAACRAFWGPEFARLPWAAVLPREGWSPAEILELLRLRLAMQFRRFV